MPKYKYEAKDLNNKTIKGYLDAADEDSLYQSLKDMSYTLVDAKEVGVNRSLYKLKTEEVADFSRQVSEMLGAGLTISRVLGILKERDAKPKLRAVYDFLYKSIYDGLTLSEAMRECGDSFPELFINMCAAGESSGQLEKTTARMAEHFDKEYKLNTKVRAAMTYPVILMIITVIAVLLIFVVVLPQFFDLFEGMDLPLVTRALMGFSSFLINYWYVLLIGILVVILIAKVLLAQPAIRVAFDRFKLRIPKIGKLLGIIYTARFARAISSLYSSGLPLVEGLSIASTLTGNKYIEKQFPEIIKDVRSGQPLSSSVEKVKEFDSKLATSIYIGEESGRLVPMLNSVSDSFDYEADVATTRMVAILEPALIVFLGIVIGSIMVAVILPILGLYESVGTM